MITQNTNVEPVAQLKKEIGLLQSMSILEASPAAVTALSSEKLVSLLKYLMLAECRLTGIPLRSSSVPMQITVADGGEDGRVEWSGLTPSTDYFPDRFCIFQSKAQKLTEARLRSEILKKDKIGLSEAIETVLVRRGAYIVFCSHPLVESAKTKLISAIRKSIEEGGGDASLAATIDIYDANKIADWANRHPSVALWLASQQRERSLSGFQTHQAWGSAVAKVDWVPSDTARYVPAEKVQHAHAGALSSDWTFAQARDACLNGLETDVRKIRVVGPSGYGKSRFVFEMLRDAPSPTSPILTSSVIYADYIVVGDEVLKLALEIADAGLDATLVVDECPDTIYRKLADNVDRAGSNLRLVTIDLETRYLKEKGLLTIQLERERDGVISSIAKSAAPRLSEQGLQIITNLSNGFPQMAVLAANQDADGRNTILTAEQLIGKVIWGSRSHQDDAERVLEALSLFEWVDTRGDQGGEAGLIAEQLAMTSFERLVEVLHGAQGRGIVERRGHFVQIVPIPLAARLASARLQKLPDTTLSRFFVTAPEGLKSSLLARLRWLDTTDEAHQFARQLLDEAQFGNLSALRTDFGAKCLERLVHVDPDRVMRTLDRILLPLELEDLGSFSYTTRAHLVLALERLVFRNATFERAARMLLRLAVAAPMNDAAARNFQQLFHLHLSGTEVAPDRRLSVVDEGLQSRDEREREICLGALGNMLDTAHFSRSGGSEEIGSAAPLEDWEPETWSDIWDFHRAGLSRLTTIALARGSDAPVAKGLIGRHIRGLIGVLPFEDIKGAVDAIIGAGGRWPEAVEQVSKWLYFNAKEADDGHVARVRDWFDALMPLDPVDRALVLTHGWPADLHDPDSRYDRSAGAGDYKYSQREAAKLVPEILATPGALARVLDEITTSDAKGTHAFAEALAQAAPDPVSLFADALAYLKHGKRPNVRFFSGLIAGADKRGAALSRTYIDAAIGSAELKSQAVSMIGAGTLTAADIKLIATLVANDEISAWQTVDLSYGQRLQHLTTAELMPLFEILRQKGTDGLWASLEILSMYFYDGRAPTERLADQIKFLMTRPELLTSTRTGGADGANLETMMKVLIRNDLVDDQFADAMTEQVMRLTVPPGTEMFHQLDGAFRNVLKLLIERFPEVVWRRLSDLLATTSPASRLFKLLEGDRDERWLGPGLVFDLPAELTLEWVRSDPAIRASRAITWLPIAVPGPDKTWDWHPALVSFIDEFGEEPDVLSRLGRRLRPSSWTGHLGHYLEPLIPLVSSWQRHRLAKVRFWAAEMPDALRRSIETDTLYDEPYR